MRPFRPFLPSLLAALLLLQWSAGLLPSMRVLAQLASGQVVEICSPEGGLQSIALDAQGKEIPKHALHAGCPLCLHAAPTSLPAPPRLDLPPMRLVALDPPRGRPGLPASPPRAPPQQPRAPPIA